MSSTSVAALFFFFLLIRLPPSSTLFPYTTLFRSHDQVVVVECLGFARVRLVAHDAVGVVDAHHPSAEYTHAVEDLAQRRSEEHTSELQSRGHLVCRLLLEKKKHKPHGKVRRAKST